MTSFLFYHDYVTSRKKNDMPGTGQDKRSSRLFKESISHIESYMSAVSAPVASITDISNNLRKKNNARFHEEKISSENKGCERKII